MKIDLILFSANKEKNMNVMQDLCKVASANVTRQEIDKRNRNSLKLI